MWVRTLALWLIWTNPGARLRRVARPFPAAQGWRDAPSAAKSLVYHPVFPSRFSVENEPGCLNMRHHRWLGATRELVVAKLKAGGAGRPLWRDAAAGGVIGHGATSRGAASGGADAAGQESGERPRGERPRGSLRSRKPTRSRDRCRRPQESRTVAQRRSR